MNRVEILIQRISEGQLAVFGHIDVQDIGKKWARVSRSAERLKIRG